MPFRGGPYKSVLNNQLGPYNSVLDIEVFSIFMKSFFTNLSYLYVLILGNVLVD